MPAEKKRRLSALADEGFFSERISIFLLTDAVAFSIF